jgi:hypothetical protein
MSVLGLLHLIAVVETGQWRWGPLEPEGSALRWVGFLLAFTGTAGWLLRRGRSEWLPLMAATSPETRLGRAAVAGKLAGGTALLLFLGLTLSVPWVALHSLGPHLLTLLRVRQYVGYGGLTCMGEPAGEVILQTLNLLAGMTLLLWAFQLLWFLLMRMGSERRPGTRAA